MDFNLKSEFDTEQKLWKVAVQGEIDIYNSEQVKEAMTKLISEQPADVYLDCENLEYIDSTGLGALVSILKKVKQYNGNIHLVKVKANVMKVFKITNLDKVFMLEGDANA